MHIKYLKYVLKHKWYVAVFGWKLGLPLWRIIKHDWSKFLPSEWFPYVNFFYGKWDKSYYTENPNKSKFSVACNKHYHRNSHHWQHHLRIGNKGEINKLTIPDMDCVEMVADWAAAGYAITGDRNNIFEWYNENRDNIIMDDKSREIVELYIQMLWITRDINE